MVRAGLVQGFTTESFQQLRRSEFGVPVLSTADADLTYVGEDLGIR